MNTSPRIVSKRLNEGYGEPLAENHPIKVIVQPTLCCYFTTPGVVPKPENPDYFEGSLRSSLRSNFFYTHKCQKSKVEASLVID